MRFARVCCVAWLCQATHAQPAAESLIEAGHWKRARKIVESRINEAPGDPLANFLLSQIRNAFGDRSAPLPLAEKAVHLDGRTAKYHRQVAEVLGVMAQHANPVQQLLLARRFRTEINAAIALDPKDRQAWRDLVEFYLLAPGIAGGDRRKAAEAAARLGKIDVAEGLLARARIAAARKDSAEEGEMLRRAAEARPPFYRAIAALAQFHLLHGDLSGAESAGRAAVELDKSRSEGYAILARVYAAKAQWEELDAVLSTSATAVPDDPIAYYRAAESLIVSGPERAAGYLRIYLAQEPEGNQPARMDAERLLERCRRSKSTSHSDTLRVERKSLLL